MDKQSIEVVENQQMQKPSWCARLGAFFTRHSVLFGAPVIVLCIYTVALFMFNVWPFSNEFTAASYDLSAQIAPFIEHVFDVFDGKSSWTYSYAIAGGADVTGTFLYFFISPFSFLFLLCGDGMVAHASSIVMGLKVATIAFAGSWFARTLFKRIPDTWCIAVGVLYAYCGYTFVSCTYINWMDFLIYLPFAVGAFKHFVQTGKYLPFSILLACCVYTCFSIACFSMLTVFPLLMIYGLLCKEKGERLRFLADVCLSFVLAILFALPILLPALSAYLQSGRSGEGLFYNFWFGFVKDTDTGKLSSFDKEVFLNKWQESLYYKWSYVFSDTLFFLLTLIWFFRCGLKKPFAKFMLLAGVMTLLPVLVDEAMLLMNMGSYMSYALRFGFLNALYFLGGACLCLEDIYTKGREEQVKTPWHIAVQASTENSQEEQNEGGMYALNEETPTREPKQKLSIWAIVFTVISVLIAAFLVWYISGDHYIEFWITEQTENDLMNALRSFPERFAHSLGGLEVIGVWLTLFAIVALVGYILYARNKIGLRLLSGILLIVVGIQAIFYNNQLVIGNRSTQHTELGQLQTICQTLNQREDGEYFRVKDYNDRFTAPASFTADCNSFSVFSSVIDRKNFTITQLFGYIGNNSNMLKSSHDYNKGNRCDEFGDSFLGYKYFVVYATSKDSLLLDRVKNTYVKPVMTTDANGEQVQLHEGDYYVFENEIVFPSAYRVGSGNFRFTAPNTNNNLNRKYNQQALYKYLRGKTLAEMKEVTGSNSSDFVTPKTARELSEYLWDKAADVQVGAGKITATTTANKGEYLFLNFVASKGYEVTVNGKKAQLEENDLHFLCVALEEGENVVEFTYKSPYVTYAGYGCAGAIIGLLAVVIVVKRTKIWRYIAPGIGCAGVVLGGVVMAFYFVFPAAVWVMKLICLLI